MPLDATSAHLIACADRGLIDASEALLFSVNDLKSKQQKCHKKDLINDREETFQAEIASKAVLVELLNHTLQRAALATRGAECLASSIEYAETSLRAATRFVTCNVCQHHFLGETQVKKHHEMHHSHIPFLEHQMIVDNDDWDERQSRNGEQTTKSKTLRDDAASLWQAANIELNSQFARDYKTVLRLKRRSTKSTKRSMASDTSYSSSPTASAPTTPTSPPTISSPNTTIQKENIKHQSDWNVDPKRWQSSMLYNAKLTLNLLLLEQKELGNWQISSGIADLMFCTPLQFRKNALALFEIPFYPLESHGERHKNANMGDAMINYLCTASAIFHLNFILQTLGEDIRKSMVKNTKESILKGFKWMKRCTFSQNYGGATRAFSWISRNQQHWPSLRDDDHTCNIHVRMIQSIGFTSVDRMFCTKISCTTPVQSILMFLNCHFDLQYHYLQAHASCEIIVRDRKQNYIIFDQLNQTANKTLSSLLNEQQQQGNNTAVSIEVVFRTIGNQKYPRFRECIPTQIAVEGIEDHHIVQGVHIAIPQGATLYHLRQIISDEMNSNNFENDQSNEYKITLKLFQNNRSFADDSDAAAVCEQKRYERLKIEEKRHGLLLQQKSKNRLKEIKKEYGTIRVETIMKRSEKKFQGNSLEWMKSSDYSRAQDKAMRLEIDLQEVEHFLEHTPFVFSEENSGDDDNNNDNGDDDSRDRGDDYYSGPEKTEKRKGKGKEFKLGREELATLTTFGPSNNPSNTHKSFSFVHRGLYVLPDEEAGILALDSAIESGSMGMTTEMEQHNRLLILLQPASGIDLGFDEYEENKASTSIDRVPEGRKKDF